ncbi:MAG: DUF2242 domain-containing protein, partial [Herminiimonas sp.]|nr:DUF2242 domain-containing protein [Herminiimonas sp.]
FGPSVDSLDKVASETIDGASFYKRFFAMVEGYLDNPPEPPAIVAVPAPIDAAAADKPTLSGQ